MKVRRLAQLSSSEWVWIIQHVLSVFFRWIERLKIGSRTNVDLHIRRAKLINWKFVWWCIFCFLREKIYLWPANVSWEKFDVWLRPYRLTTKAKFLQGVYISHYIQDKLNLDTHTTSNDSISLPRGSYAIKSENLLLSVTLSKILNVCERDRRGLSPSLCISDILSLLQQAQFSLARL